jgi:hypothetical protein
MAEAIPTATHPRAHPGEGVTQGKQPSRPLAGVVAELPEDEASGGGGTSRLRCGSRGDGGQSSGHDVQQLLPQNGFGQECESAHC